MQNTEIKKEPAPSAGLFNQIIAVTNRHLCTRPFLEQIERVCRLHPRALILREKDLPEEEYSLLFSQVFEICGRYQVPCICHTYYQAAKAAGSRQIHLPLPILKSLQDTDVLNDFDGIGVSVHSADEARLAASLGASYLTAGHIFQTDCKKGLPPRGLDFLEEVCQSVSIPVYAIGGIQADAAQLSLIQSRGAAGGCIMSGMMRI